ncbi:MAG: DUF1570 domain-containing protein [Phycisphaerales bacterium]|nr:DUF1570 domain-containing protein [Phycisphaerales bacterium]
MPDARVKVQADFGQAAALARWRDSRAALGVFCAVSFVIAGCTSNSATPAVTHESEPWAFRGRSGTKLITLHYEIFTTLRDEALLSGIPEMCESAYGEYAKLIPPQRGGDERMKVYLFASRPEWVEFTREFTGPRAGIFLKVRNGGYSEQGVSVIQYVSHDITFPLLAHEGFHQYLYCCVNDQVPAWLNEGLAVYFEGQELTGDNRTRFSPWNNPGRSNALAEALIRKKLFPMAEILDTNAGRIAGMPPRMVGTYYAQLWALIGFLIEGEGGKHADGFARLLKAVSGGELEQFARAAHVLNASDDYSFGRSLFEAFITKDLSAFEDEFVRYAKQKTIGDK